MEDTTQRLQEAITAARAGRLAEARSIAEELTESDPENAHAWFLRGILSEDEDQQRAYLSRTLELDPEHQAARKRMEQMEPVDEGEAADEAEAEEVAEEVAEGVALQAAAEPEEDATMVAESGAFLAAAAADDDMAAEVFARTPPPEAFEQAGDTAEEAVAEAVDAAAEEAAEAVEETFEDTMIAESPFAEEMAAEDLQVEALFGEVSTEEDESESEDEGLATVFAVGALLDEEEVQAREEMAQETAEAPEEAGELQASDLAEAAADATLLDEAGEAWLEEEAGEDLWAKVEAEAVPDWLIEDTTVEAEATMAEESLADTFTGAEAEITREQELPDWLLEEPEEDWSEALEATEDYDEAPPTAVTPMPEAEEPFDEEAPAPLEEEAPVPAAPKKRSSTRGLEILLFLLIIVALVIVVAIAYFLVYPPSF